MDPVLKLLFAVSDLLVGLHPHLQPLIEAAKERVDDYGPRQALPDEAEKPAEFSGEPDPAEPGAE